MGLIWVTAAGLVLSAPPNLSIDPVVLIQPTQGCCGYLYLVPMGERVTVPAERLPAHVVWSWRVQGVPEEEWGVGGRCDVNLDGATGTDQDIEAFFAAFEDGGGSADWDGDNSPGTDADIREFFRSLSE